MARLNFFGDVTAHDAIVSNGVNSFWNLGKWGMRGWAWRQRVGSGLLLRLGFDELSGTNTTTKTSIYVRYFINIRAIPTVGNIRYAYTFGNAAGGIGCWLDSTGALHFDNWNSGAGSTIVTSPVKTINTQIEVKLRMQAHSVGDDAKVQIIVDDVELYNNFGAGTLPGSGIGLNAYTNINSWAFELLNIDNGADYDISNCSVDDLEYPDDTRVTFIPISGAGNYTNWLGGSTDWRFHVPPTFAGFSPITTALLSTRHSYALPTLASQGITGNIKSVKVVCMRGVGAGATNGKLFVRRNGVDIDTTSLFTYSDQQFLAARFNPTGWATTDTLEVGFISGAAAGTYGMRNIGLLVEHDTPYNPSTEDTVQVNSQNYTGAAAPMTITFPYEPDMVLIMGRTGTGGGTHWFRGLLGPKPNNVNQLIGSGIVIIGNKMHLLDTNAAYNTAAVVYDVLTLKNPSNRVFDTAGWGAAGNILPLFRTSYDIPFSWQPDAAIALVESSIGGGGQVNSYRINGLPTGSAPSWTAQTVPATNHINDFIATGVRVGVNSMNASMVDGSLIAAFKENFYNSKLFKFATYTGNAVNPRTIPIDLGGGTPYFVIVRAQTTAQAYARTTGMVDSMNFIGGAGSSALAVTAMGVDSITVNSALNANGVLYAVMAFATGADVPSINEPQGIYAIIPGQTHDELYQRLNGVYIANTDVKIPNPTFRSAFVGEKDL